MKYGRIARALALGALVALVLLAIAIGLFVLIWGWQRFLLDFWPLDASRVGPNLCASVTVVILITAHNEYRVIVKDEEHHASVRQVARNAVREALHPAEEAEEHVAADVARDTQ